MSEEKSIETNEPIQGLVAGVITERELAINIGSNDGVTNGMKFRITSNTPSKIEDPNTGETLGSITRDKVRVKAVTVEERYSICRTYTYFTQSNSLSSMMHVMSSSNPPRKIPVTLKAEDADYLPDLSEEESYVKKGDVVRQITEEDE
jgi:hypothetical protein